MQEKELIMVVRCELKIPSLGITIRHYLGGLMMLNSYPHAGLSLWDDLGETIALGADISP